MSYERVKANRGAAGVDGQTIAMFEENLKDNLYKLWNRMSSGSYFLPAVRYVDIPKSDGKTRTLGIPTVSDRIAQMVVKMQLEPMVEAHFHPDSYGYRPKRSAHDAREQCFIVLAKKKSPRWVLEGDISACFDRISHDWLLKNLLTGVSKSIKARQLYRLGS